MSEEEVPGGDPLARPRRLEPARLWLTGHGLADVEPTSVLAARLGVRQRARVVASIVLAAFLIGIALAYVSTLPVDTTVESDRTRSLWVLAAMVVGVVLAQVLLDRWVRRVDRRVGATLARRAALPVRLGWRTVLGVPRAAVAAGTVAGAAVMAFAGLAVSDPGANYAAVLLLLGLCGVVVATLVQLHHILTRPAVADDEDSLTVDVLLRVEDAREAAAPTVVWSLPVVSVLATAPGWWIAAWLGFIVLGVAAFLVVTWRTRSSAAVARLATAR
ncbi:hypothetical protein [Pseudonocardia lacus]|uniref:hypothetical protein n=1 Tax=Pseudonocardia lacus TaxID=2835865 RepID=UPI001BDC6F87|nr:hypothetical protein [Pseudonocardia lacus]